jgi:uncharacterized protein YodC (DUF2158 family)
VKYKIGDVVMLASAGPDMTVIALPVKKNTHVCCAWFTGGELTERWLPCEALLRAVAEGVPAK